MNKELCIKTVEGISLKGNIKESILGSAQKNNLHFEYSCKNGQCGICKVSLLGGEIEELQAQTALHKKDIENKKILTCCCAPKTDILIDAEDLSALRDIEIKTYPARINKIEKKTDQIIEIDLRLPPTANLTFLEGQFIDIIGHQGVRRSYSIANSNNEKQIKLFIKKVENGALSQYWFNEAKENDLLRIEGPKGSFFFREPKKNIILLATGTGIAPIKSILDKLSEAPELFGNTNLSLYWGNRKIEDFFWQPDYALLKVNYTPVLSRNNKEWQGQIGYVQDKAIKNKSNLGNTQIYACGSLEMIESAKALFLANALEEKHFYSDAFVSS